MLEETKAGGMTDFDPYSPRQPKKDGKPKGKLKPQELQAELTRRDTGDAEPTISIRTSDGIETGPVPMSVVKAALKVMKGENDPTAEMQESVSTAQTVAAGQLRAFVERIERVEEDLKALSDDRKEIYSEAKGTGFDARAIRTLVRLRKQDPAERQEREAILDLYKSALGME